MSNHSAISKKVEEIARCLSEEHIRKTMIRNPYYEADELGDSMQWLDHVDDADRLHKDGAIVIGGKLVI